MPKMTKDSEIELKLLINPADAGAFRQLALWRKKGIAKPVRRKVFCVYFDTPDLLLKQHCMAMRLRRVGSKWMQTLKTAGNSTGGLHQRGEWEYPLSDPQLDLSRFRDTPLASLAQSQALHLKLKPLFTTEFVRTAWLLETSPGQQVEVALDMGVIRCAGREAEISEVEIELLDGSAATVYDCALTLARQIPLRPEILSKAERGYGLFQCEPLVPRRAAVVTLKREWRLDEAMRVIVAACIDHFAANVDGALTRDDLEYIHQLRVSLRRLRSAMRIFRPAHAGHIAEELKWLTGALGDARDWDVLMSTSLPALLATFGDSRLAIDLTETGEQRQADARAVARNALASARAAQLQIAIGRWLGVAGELTLQPRRDTGKHHAAHRPAIPRLPQLASSEIRRRRRRLLRASGHRKDSLAALSAASCHRVRILAKRLRYAVDFLSSLFDESEVTPTLKILGNLQDLLGETNDNAVAMRLVDSIGAPKRFIDFARGWFAMRTEARLVEADRLIAELRNARQFRKD